MAIYYVRADGEAVKANATSASAASTSLSVAEFNKVTDFSAGDTIYFCSEGGDYVDSIIPASDGSTAANIVYDGDPGATGTRAKIDGTTNSLLRGIDFTQVGRFRTFTSTPTFQPVGYPYHLFADYPSWSGYAVRTGTNIPDAADVQVKVGGLDLLGGKGTSLIPATDIVNETAPYNTFNGLYRYPVIDGDITVPIANEGTAGFDATIKLIFSR